MIRFGLVIWLIVATAVAVGLYHINYEVEALEEELKQVRGDIRRERERLDVLEAEWSYLNRPARLARLAREHLDMATLQPDQIVRIGQLPPRITGDEDAPRATGDRPDDAVPLPKTKPWSLQPQLSAASPFAPGDRRRDGGEVSP
jgi:cell division protein FtsL